MANNNEPLKEAPDPQFLEMLRIITGLNNITDGELSKPILRPTIQDTYVLYIIQYALLSFIGAVSNIWIIYYISKHKLYRDNTHAFFINLSVCHFVQSAFVVPITLVTTIVHNWILGQFMCFFVPMLQVSSYQPNSFPHIQTSIGTFLVSNSAFMILRRVYQFWEF